MKPNNNSIFGDFKRILKLYSQFFRVTHYPRAVLPAFPLSFSLASPSALGQWDGKQVDQGAPLSPDTGLTHAHWIIGKQG